MNLEVLISTMHQKDFSLIERMNIKTDAMIINQCDHTDGYMEIIHNYGKVRMESNNDRGLSKSRNLAIANSIAEICVIADDDLIYKDNYEEIIKKAYEEYYDADMIIFDVPSKNRERPTATLKEGRVDFLHSMKISSFQITFKRHSLLDKHISFNELFGAGAKYVCGEENILLTKCLKMKLKIIFVKKEIAVVNHNESTWYNGFNEELFKTKGAMFYEMSSVVSYLLVLQFALRKWNLYKADVGLISVLNFMFQGLREYKKSKNSAK